MLYNIWKRVSREVILFFAFFLSPERKRALERHLRGKEEFRKLGLADVVVVSFGKSGRVETVPDFINDYVSWGAGPRASQYLILGAKARSMLHGRAYASTEDVRAVAPPVLRHRIITNFNAEAEGIKTDDIIRRLAEIIPTDPSKTSLTTKLPQIFKSSEARTTEP